MSEKVLYKSRPTLGLPVTLQILGSDNFHSTMQHHGAPPITWQVIWCCLISNATGNTIILLPQQGIESCKRHPPQPLQMIQWQYFCCPPGNILHQPYHCHLCPSRKMLLKALFCLVSGISFNGSSVYRPPCSRTVSWRIRQWDWLQVVHSPLLSQPPQQILQQQVSNRRRVMLTQRPCSSQGCWLPAYWQQFRKKQIRLCIIVQQQLQK